MADLEHKIMISTDEEHALGIPGSMLGRCAAVESRKECALGMPDSTVGRCAAAADPAAIADAFLSPRWTQ